MKWGITRTERALVTRTAVITHGMQQRGETGMKGEEKGNAWVHFCFLRPQLTTSTGLQ